MTKGRFGILAAALVFAATQAHAFFGNDEYDISGFCEVSADRETIIYIDDTMMVEGSTAWAERIDAKLLSSLMPSERVTLLRLSPEQGRVSEIWTGCWPAYSQEQQEKLEAETYLLQKHPLKVLETQQQVFRQGFGNGLSQIYTAAMRPAGASPSTVVPKQIIRALAADEGRFGRRAANLRVVIYSDMVENSEYGIAPDSDSTAASAEIAKQLGLNLQHAMVYAFGFGDTGNSSGLSLENTRAFWAAFTDGAKGHLVALGSELTAPATLPVAIHSYDVEASVQDRTVIGRMHLAANADGELQDSYITFGSAVSSLISGELLCQADGTCVLDAVTTTGTLTTTPEEHIALRGTIDVLTGNIGFEGEELVDGQPAVFPLSAKRIVR